MCLAIPMKVIKIEGDTGTVELQGVSYQANLQLLEDVGIGEYVLVHAGYAIERVDEKYAEETLELLKDLEAQ